MLSKIFSYFSEAFKQKKPQAVQHICGNCSLFIPPDGVSEGSCSAAVFFNSEILSLNCQPSDKCFWEENEIPINQVRVWDNKEE